MGTIVDGFNTTYRDYSTAGVPSSGAHEPAKAEIRALGASIEQAVSLISTSGATVVKTTKALLDADLAHAAGVVAIVWNDATAVNNGVYVKSGSSGSGSWGQAISWGDIDARLDVLEADAAGKAALDAVKIVADRSEAKSDTLADLINSFSFGQMLDSRINDIRTVAKFVDAVSGSNSNTGNDALSPYQTLEHAINNTSAGQVIALRAGQRHNTGGIATNVAVNRALVTYGDGATPAVLDARQALNGVTWTARPGTTNCWEAVVVGRATTANNGVNSASWTYHLWFPNDVHGVWKVGGADIAANVAAVDGQAGAYTVHREGSLVQDPRSDSNATTYRWIIRMPDSSNPNGKDIWISDRSAAWASANGLALRDMIQYGASGKDFASSPYSFPFAVLDGVERRDVNQHGHVGPAHVRRTFKAVGYAIPGTTTGDGSGRANGGGYNIFSANDLTSRDIDIDTLDLTNFLQGLYGHGSGNKLYRNVNVRRIKANNVRSVVQFDAAGGQAVVVGTLDIGRIEATNVKDMLSVAVNKTIVRGGHIDFAGINPFNGLPVNQPTLVLTNNTDANEVILEDLTWNFPLARSLTQQNNIYYRNTSVGGGNQTPVIRMRNCRDLSPAANKGTAFRSGTNTWVVILRLEAGTQIGSIQDQGSGTNYPAGLFVEAGCAFGMGNRTGPEIETALTGAGLVNGVDFNISGQTTIVGLDGLVKSQPGWK